MPRRTLPTLRTVCESHEGIESEIREIRIQQRIQDERTWDLHDRIAKLTGNPAVIDAVRSARTRPTTPPGGTETVRRAATRELSKWAAFAVAAVVAGAAVGVARACGVQVPSAPAHAATSAAP